jgi:hypothetical protein
MYVPDLAPLDNNPRHLAVGWLDAAHPFPTGDLGEEFLDRLFDLCANPIIRTRGFHECPFCPKQGRIRECSRNGRPTWLGSGQIRLRRYGKTYEGPNLLYHYVLEHKYRPPDAFIEAVLRPRNWFQRKWDWFVFNAQ